MRQHTFVNAPTSVGKFRRLLLVYEIKNCDPVADKHEVMQSARHNYLEKLLCCQTTKCALKQSTAW